MYMLAVQPWAGVPHLRELCSVPRKSSNRSSLLDGLNDGTGLLDRMCWVSVCQCLMAMFNVKSEFSGRVSM